MVLDAFLTNEQKNTGVKQLFQSYIDNPERFEEIFYDCFEYPYSVFFRDYDYQKSLLKILQKYYRNDFFIRYSFFKKRLTKHSAVSVFEVPIEESRIDIASINGNSVAYEIKTNYDSYIRLKKQLQDYSTCFEYVYVICPHKKINAIKKIVPDWCGIICYNDKISCEFLTAKDATFTKNLNPQKQLKNMRKSELKECFGSSDTDYIISNYSSDLINTKFKSALKKRFTEKSNQLKKRCSSL